LRQAELASFNFGASAHTWGSLGPFVTSVPDM
jgi:hypothetical protein